MNSIKKGIDFLKFYFQIWFYEFIIFVYNLKVFFFENTSRLKKLFFKRIKTYFLFLLLFYIFQSHLDYMMYENYAFMHNYVNSYRDFVWRDKTFYFFLACFIFYTLYFIISLIFLKFYDYITLIGKSLAMIFFAFTFKYYAWFYELELHYLYDEGNFLSIFLLYFFMYWGVHAVEFGYNLEEEFDDPKWNRLSKEAEKNNTFQPIFGWFNNKTSKNDSSETINISEKDQLMSQIFGDIDDYGESVEQTFARYSAHIKRMYPEFVHFDDMTDEEREYELALRKFCSTPSTVEETVEWSYYSTEKWRNFYANKVESFFFKYRYFFRTILIFQDWLKVGSFFRARAVGFYSNYNPLRKFNRTWYNSRCFNITLSIPYFGRTISLRFLFVFFNWVKNNIKKISIFYLINNFKWNRFHYKYYPQLKKLRKWGSGNYNFFKTKNI